MFSQHSTYSPKFLIFERVKHINLSNSLFLSLGEKPARSPPFPSFPSASYSPILLWRCCTNVSFSTTWEFLFCWTLFCVLSIFSSIYCVIWGAHSPITSWQMTLGIHILRLCFTKNIVSLHSLVVSLDMQFLGIQLLSMTILKVSSIVI